jgi:hypothetical protein
MSASINGENISLTRGDSLILHVNIMQNEEPYVPREGDVVRFAMKKNINDEDVLILKDVDLDSMEVVIEPEDTKSLSYGTYKYDIELTTVGGFVDTFIGPANFKITEEVY